METVPSAAQVGHYSAHVDQSGSRMGPLGPRGGKPTELGVLDGPIHADFKTQLHSPKEERKTPVFPVAQLHASSLPSLVIGTLDDEGTEPAVSEAGAREDLIPRELMDVDDEGFREPSPPTSPQNSVQSESRINEPLVAFLRQRRRSVLGPRHFKPSCSLRCGTAHLQARRAPFFEPTQRVLTTHPCLFYVWCAGK